MRLKKVVFPVAGHGSRFLPATKATPKEMLPVVDKPLIQYAVEEALEAGFTELIFITGKTKRAITDHFDVTLEIGVSNMTDKKKQLFDEMNNIIPKSASCIYIRQGEPLGLGHAILQAKPVLGDEPFAVVLADDLIDAKPGVLKQMMDRYDDSNTSLIAVEKIKKADSIHYGMIKIDSFNKALANIIDIIEKPEPVDAPSDFGVVGRYIFTNQILDYLAKTNVGTGNEIQLTDAIKSMLATNNVSAYEFSGTRYDCGDKLGFVKANIEYALKNNDFGVELESYLRNRLT
ncbi:MAG: UTP--glucose-1-phosphate uridylyltransferase GalU [Proteobacteria bacterium]|jgi:UTP--glucose-1-phosphate uridylyltransferase|nr:UTP--glucose-1-phosphate uridylyltransferase GalU [Pseudomonadota bacterium]MDA0872489.1 UTP--glucose-1-phosphate uridylyltransferase GalU [Pseudomonadota bacterium]MDA1133846.1 UTP--glucose-1-phosphate uridylyltransferase GalU [Pseudomonadota bacterium]